LRRDKDALREEKALLETELALARSAAGDAERTSAIAQTASERLQHENEALRAQITDFDAAMREGARLRAGLEADRAKAIAQAEQVAEEAVRVRKEHAAVVEDLERRLSARDREVEVCIL
jgi:DNA repair exonuclease SbcCD ATPase subunit